jgi:hypothetical protein
MCTNLFGIFLFIPQEEINLSPDEMVDDQEGSNIEAEQNNLHASNLDSENLGAKEKIDWRLLPQDRNPSAKLFLDQQIIGIEFNLPEMFFEQTEEGEIVHLDSCDVLLEPGKPLVPECRFFAAVPPGSKVKNVEIVKEKTHILESNHMIAPFLPRTLDNKKVPVEPDSEVYSSDDFFPSSLYKLQGPDKLRHLDALEVILYPVRVRPASGIVEVFDRIRLFIELEIDQVEQMIPPSIRADDSLDKTILDLIVNPEDVRFSSYESPKGSGTRAPSTIYHTLGFQGSASAIHPIKDTTVGNVGGEDLLQENDDIYYIAEATKTLYVDGFDISSANPLANLEYAVLYLQYVGNDGYNGDSKVRWALEGNSLQYTTIQPEDLDDNESADLSYDLLGHAGSPTTVSDLADLDIEFKENGVGAGSKDIPFDYFWIEFAYREELTGDSDYLIITNLQMADELRPLAEWKTNRLCLDAQVFDTDWIDSTCNGEDLLHKIYDFIRSMFENYSIEWVLIGGDEKVVPTNTTSKGYDSFYANVVGFVYPDIAVGRLPTTQDDIMEGMVADILAHQRDMRSWKRNMYLIGTNVFNTGDGKRDMEYIKTNYLEGHDLTFYEDYEVEGNISRSRTIDTYNLGMGASVITGHGSRYGWYMTNGTKNFFNKNDVNNSMSNSDKRGFVWSSTCSSGGFVGSYVSIGEMWLVARDGGGIGYIGAAEIAWYSSTYMLYRAFFNAYDEILDAGEDPTQGMCHLQALNRINYRIYNLFGDPQVGLTISKPNVEVITGSFGSGTFVEQSGFDQNEQATFKTTIKFPQSVLPRGVHLNFSVHNEAGDVYYLNETYIDDPEDVNELIFWNWTVPTGVAPGIYNVTIRIYNKSQGWEFVIENGTYFFIDYHASMFWVEQVNSEVIEDDIVTYKVHIDNFIEPIPAGKVWVQLEGRDYDPYLTPFDYYEARVVTIPAVLDFVVQVQVKVFEPGTYNVTAGLHIGWALMDLVEGNETEVRGIRILEVTYNYPLYFREDQVNISYRYFAFSDFIGKASLFVEDQTDQIYASHNFLNGTNWINFTWTVPKYHPNGTHDIDLEIYGLGRSLETRVESMRVVIVREILNKGENWLISRQQSNGGWNESNWVWPPGTNYNETARAMQALIWSGVNPSDPVIKNAADYVENSLNISIPGRIDDFAQCILALVDAERDSSPKVQNSAEIIRKMQNWIYEPENWTICFSAPVNESWIANISGYDGVGNLLYKLTYNGTFDSSETAWLNFSMVPGTIKLNVTVNTTARWFSTRSILPPLYKLDPTWWGQSIIIDDNWGSCNSTIWNWSISEEIEFDRGWGKKKGMNSIAGFTAWAIIGLLQSSSLGPLEHEALATGVQWLLDNQSDDGSWYPFALDGGMGGGMGGGYAYPELIVGGWAACTILNTALPVIALVMNGTVGKAVDDAVAWLKLKQEADGSYPTYPFSPWDWRVNLVSTAHTLRALRRAGYVFEIGSPFVKEAVRFVCIAQSKDSGNWDEQANYTRVSSEAMLALASLRFMESLRLEEGWNLISISLVLSNNSLSSVLASINGDYDAVQWYDTTDIADPWKHCKVGKPYGNDLFEINKTMGFWIHVTKPGGTTIVYNGSEPKRNQEITLHRGWNMVSYPSVSNRKRTTALNNIIFGSDVDAIWTFNAVTQNWEEVGTLDYFEVGRGYWVHSKTTCVWQVPI